MQLQFTETMDRVEIATSQATVEITRLILHLNRKMNSI